MELVYLYLLLKFIKFYIYKNFVKLFAIIKSVKTYIYAILFLATLF